MATNKENILVESIPYLNKLIVQMEDHIDRLSQALITIDKSNALQEQRLVEVQKYLTLYTEKCELSRSELIERLAIMSNDNKKKQSLASERLYKLENQINKFKWIFSGANAMIFIVIFLLQIDGFTVATGPW